MPLNAQRTLIKAKLNYRNECVHDCKIIFFHNPRFHQTIHLDGSHQEVNGFARSTHSFVAASTSQRYLLLPAFADTGKSLWITMRPIQRY